MNLSANFSRFREYSISISDFLRKKSCRSWRSCTLISVCCSRHFCCSMSWARISNKRRTCHTSQWKQMRTEHYQLKSNVPEYFSLCSYTSCTWISGLVVGCSSGSSHLCHGTPMHRGAVSSCPLPFSHKWLWQGKGSGLCWAHVSRSASPFLSHPLALARHLARSNLLVGGGVQLFGQQLLLLPWKMSG